MSDFNYETATPAEFDTRYDAIKRRCKDLATRRDVLVIGAANFLARAMKLKRIFTGGAPDEWAYGESPAEILAGANGRKTKEASTSMGKGALPVPMPP